MTHVLHKTALLPGCIALGLFLMLAGCDDDGSSAPLPKTDGDSETEESDGGDVYECPMILDLCHWQPRHCNGSEIVECFLQYDENGCAVGEDYRVTRDCSEDGLVCIQTGSSFNPNIVCAEPETVDGDGESDETGEEIPTIPACGTGEIYPCAIEVSFTRTSESGEFRVGTTRNRLTFLPSVWEGWIAFYQNTGNSDAGVHDGLFLFDYLTEKAFLLSPRSENALTVSMNARAVVWEAHVQQSQDSDEFIREMDWQMFEIHDALQENMLVAHPSEINGRYFWTASEPDQDVYHLFTLGSNNLKKRLDNVPSESGIGVGAYDVSADGSYLAYWQWGERIIHVDLETYTETIIKDRPYLKQNVVVEQDRIYWSDADTAEAPSHQCGFSIMEHDLDSGQTRTVVEANGADKRVEDVWQDWMVYIDYAGNGDCRIYTGFAMGDVVLRYLPTGEEWRITNDEFDQIAARMWNNLIVWIDYRHGLDVSDLYGIDLCMHPELKSRFPGCDIQLR